MMTVKTALHQGANLLDEGAVLAPRLTAEVLLCHALGKDRTYLFTHPEAELSQVAWLHYGRYLFERIKGKPTQYITRQQEFYGRDFLVTPHVLIPRPETELLVEAALKHDGRIVDVGTGSGAIAITLSLEKRTRIIATDISAPALQIASKNAQNLGATVDYIHGDLLSSIASRTMDAVVSNPPYISHKDRAEMQREVRDHEPHLALFAGPTGAEIYQRLIADSARVLKPGGHLLLELGYDSLTAMRAMLDENWTAITITDDLAGIPRVLSARYQP
jgi:release factor glutamine methyltransferase